MATNLGKAYVQIMPSARGISGMISKEISGEVNSAGQQAGNTLVSKIKSVILAAGIGKLFATSLMEGGKLQQSLGGIETLFKKNADTVKQYANEAYKTAGLSANAYMENVTGFSASLLQSLGGDTAKAAKIANMAMIDMADNSNKMGTSMELIQNAYQGFAKQNYTMLDNLKLGYGGTKQEMQRLLADAQKLTGVKYDINNLSDVYEAIHVIQKELGITGTTAKEASSTLQGSFFAMKAAFTNLLGKLSLGQDIRPSLEALASTTTIFLVGNFLPMVGNILKGLPTLLIGAFSGLAGQLKGILGGEVVSKIQEYLGQVTVAVESFIDVLTGAMSKQESVDLMSSLGIDEGTANTIVNIADNIRTAFQNIWEAIKNVGTIVGEFIGDLLGINSTESSVSGLGTTFEVLSGVVKTVTGWIKDFTTFLRENETATSLVKGALYGLLTGFIALKVVDSIKLAITGFTTALTIAKNTMAAFQVGITVVRGVIATARAAMMLFNATLLANPITGVIVAITAVVAALTWFFTQTEIGKAIWQGFVDWIKQAWQGISEFFSNLWTGISTVAITAWNMITQTVMAVVQPFIEIFTQAWSVLKETINTIWEGIKMIFQGAWEFIKSIVLGAALIIIDLVTGNFTKLKEDLQLIWEGIKNAIQIVWGGIKTIAVTVWTAIKTFIVTLVTGLVNGIKTLWEGFKTFFSTLINGVKNIAVNTWNSIKNSVVNTVNNLVGGAKRAWEDLKISVSETVDRVKNFFNKLWDINLFDIGKSIMRGFLNGLKNIWEDVKSFVGKIGDWIRDHKGPIEYDRKLLIPAGIAIMKGLDEGLIDKFKAVKSTVSSIAGEINKGFTSEITDIEVGSNIIKDLDMDYMATADFSFSDKNDDVINALTDVQDLLQKIADKDVSTYLDGERLAKNSYDRQMTFVRREGI
ncbi:phage tail protein [Gemella bergeri]